MAQNKAQIQAMLADADSSPVHRFGQNFMIDQNLVRTVVTAGEIKTGDVVIEVGPGTGTLTEELLTSPAFKVVAVEIDRKLTTPLREKFAPDQRFHLIDGDALAGKHELNAELLAVIQSAGTSPVKLIANLPYNIASPLVIELLLAGVSTLVFTVQKEVADRVRASAGSQAYGPITVMAQMLAEVEVLRTLPPQAFWPMPKIHSALVRMKRADRVGTSAAEFGRFVQQLFSARRKTLRKSPALAQVDTAAVLQATGFDGQQRPEEFSPEQLWALFQAVKSIG